MTIPFLLIRRSPSGEARVKGVNSQLMVRTIKGTKLLDIKDLNGLVFMALKSENPEQLPTKFINKELS